MLPHVCVSVAESLSGATMLDRLWKVARKRTATLAAAPPPPHLATTALDGTSEHPASSEPLLASEDPGHDDGRGYTQSLPWSMSAHCRAGYSGVRPSLQPHGLSHCRPALR